MTCVAAAVVQAAPVAFDVEATVAKVERLTAAAAAGGAGLVVFPEAFVSCYPRGITFGATVGGRSPEGRAWFRRYWESSVDVPGPVVDRLGAIAREQGVYLVIGVIERDGGTLYCTALFLEPGRHVARQAPQADAYRGRAPRLGLRRRLDAAGARHGGRSPRRGHLLGELHAALRMAMYAKGVQIWCAPTADARDTWIATMQHIACEGRCFVLSANQFATRGDYPSDYPLEDGGGDAGDVLCRGGSVIVSPLGHVLAGPAFGEETVLRADLDLDRIAEAKYDFDVVGHYARPDVFTLTVDERPRPPVVDHGA